MPDRTSTEPTATIRPYRETDHAAVYAAAARAGAAGVHVTVTTANTRALGFYDRLGFRRLDITEPGETTVTVLGRRL